VKDIFSKARASIRVVNHSGLPAALDNFRPSSCQRQQSRLRLGTTWTRSKAAPTDWWWRAGNRQRRFTSWSKALRRAGESILTPPLLSFILEDRFYSVDEPLVWPYLAEVSGGNAIGAKQARSLSENACQKTLFSAERVVPGTDRRVVVAPGGMETRRVGSAERREGRGARIRAGFLLWFYP